MYGDGRRIRVRVFAIAGVNVCDLNEQDAIQRVNAVMHAEGGRVISSKAGTDEDVATIETVVNVYDSFAFIRNIELGGLDAQEIFS